MTTVISKKKGGSKLPLGTLIRDAQRLLGALQDGTIGSPVVDRLSAAFVADFTTQVALVAKLDTDQSTAIGAVSSLTSTQNQAQADFVLLSSAVRRIAKFALAGQDTILRSEFQVGLHTPSGLPALLARGRKLLTACQTYAAELAPHGWSAANTDALATALESLTGLDQSQEASKDQKQGRTADRTAGAKRLYQQCPAVQAAGRIVYAIGAAPAGAATVEARAFPPRRVPAPAKRDRSGRSRPAGHAGRSRAVRAFGAGDRDCGS